MVNHTTFFHGTGLHTWLRRSGFTHSAEHEQEEDVVSLAVRGKRLFEKSEEPNPVRILSVFLLETERLLAML